MRFGDATQDRISPNPVFAVPQHAAELGHAPAMHPEAPLKEGPNGCCLRTAMPGMREDLWEHSAFQL